MVAPAKATSREEEGVRRGQVTPDDRAYWPDAHAFAEHLTKRLQAIADELRRTPLEERPALRAHASELQRRLREATAEANELAVKGRNRQ